ncbi:MAG: DUF4011 domain-containing protein [Acidobacteria bacterium]|nr:DUF4011 domain-containing protein [Acidobacteriota bacterium]
MPGTADSEPLEQASPNISSDFLTGNTEIGLDRIRTRLLDLTNRNRLLNFRFSASSSLRVVGVSIDSAFKRLWDNGKLAFLPVPDPDPPASEKDRPAKDYAEELGWSTSFDLDDAEEDEVRSLPVLLYQERLDTVGRKIGTAARTAIEESGTNMLYLIFGFLEWYESDDSKQPHLAPLVSVPVTIDRTGGRARAIDTVIEASGEDIETNLSLVEKMRRDFGLELPFLEDEDTPIMYFEKFVEILKVKKQWRIRRQISLALLSFGKLLMYRDLDPKNWPKAASIAKHPLVRELFEGSKSPTVSLAEEFPIDAPEIEKEVPHLIRDADSSQHSALIHALRGQNLVIEGPPGTGNSQTITNLIAAALAKGKTVLFVSEKLAALEVVRRRLDDAGLGMFCLELHSHKTKKGVLINDLTQRLKMKGSFKDPRDLDRHLAVVADKKRLLTRYASLINKTVQPLDATVFDVLWARDRWSQQTAPYRGRLAQLFLPVVLRYTPTDVTQAEHLLSAYAQHLTAVLPAGGTISEHPWAWVTKPVGFVGEERIFALLEDLLLHLKQADQCSSELGQAAGIALPNTVRGLDDASVRVSSIPSPPKALRRDLLEWCRSVSNRRLLSQFLAHAECFQRQVKVLRAHLDNVDAVIAPTGIERLSAAVASLDRLGIDNASITGVRDIRTKCQQFSGLLLDARNSFCELWALVGCDAPFTISGIGVVLQSALLLHHAPFDQLHLRQRNFEDDRARPALEAAIREATALKDSATRLAGEYDLTAAEMFTPAQLIESAAAIEQAPLWQRMFGSDYKRAVAVHRQLAPGRTDAARNDMSRGFRNVAEHVQWRARFNEDADYRHVLGPHFRGVDTAWDDLQTLVAWYEQVFIALPEHQPESAPFRRLLFDARTERLKAIKTAFATTNQGQLTVLNSVLSRLADLRNLLPRSQSPTSSGSLDQIGAYLSQRVAELNEVIETCEAFGMRDDVPVRELATLQDAAAECRRAVDAAQGMDELRAAIGESDSGVETDTGPLMDSVQFAEAVTSASLPARAVERLLCADCETNHAELRRVLTSSFECGQAIRKIAKALGKTSGAAITDYLEEPRTSLEGFARANLSHREELPKWNRFVRSRLKIREAGLEKLTALAESGSLKAGDLGTAFNFVLYNTLAYSVFGEHDDLSQVTGVTQELIQRQFADADREAIRLYSDRVAAIIDRRMVPYGNKNGPVRTWTETALIINEVNKQKRHIPIRQLVLRSGNALLALKPCFMMGPLSVAQYLAPGQLRFDLVVMDEASQLRPEDAIGALARGGQIVVVGDPKQLPPTSFFQRVSIDADGEADEDVRTAVEEGESILDVASTLFQPVRRLRWHYRSRHHSLIAFSNHEFYQRDLIIFPSAYHEDQSLGVRYRPVPDGVFENSRNPREAAVVVDAVLNHMREHPTESLGVVTLNFEQRELLEELLDRRLRDDPAAVAYQEAMTGGQETLFIKNLENVQGDERDVIFISTTYGPDRLGNQFQRFGPINSNGGHRRLNVLFTRAKKRTVVFSSLDPERIQTNPNSPWGVRALKQYLIFARTGILEGAEERTEQPINDFERSVGTVLREKGYEVAPQVGVAGFFIDLGVKHPMKAGTFILGVECDGASYHSGRSARDRDRLRQEILENLGWKIHRIWSTDWFKNREGEINRLLSRLSDIVQNDPECRAAQQEASRTESLRQRLITLRELEIKPAFPETPPERGLLKKSLLDEFVQKKPKTRDDWFRKISQNLRTEVDPKQIGRFLDRVLEVIRENE